MWIKKKIFVNTIDEFIIAEPDNKIIGNSSIKIKDILHKKSSLKIFRKSLFIF